MNPSIPVATLDGPSGAGKGTVSRLVASQLGWNYLDSGAIYRALALAATEAACSLEDENLLIALAAEMDLRFGFGKEPAVFLSEREISRELQSEICGNNASRIAAMPGVRQALLKKQRDFRRLPGLVADGRDMGTIVFPDARHKFYLTADLNVRAQRRVKQLKEKGMNVNLDQIIVELSERDRRDKNRAAAPLVQAEGAIVIDSSDKTIDQVVQYVTGLITG